MISKKTDEGREIAGGNCLQNNENFGGRDDAVAEDAKNSLVKGIKSMERDVANS